MENKKIKLKNKFIARCTCGCEIIFSEQQAIYFVCPQRMERIFIVPDDDEIILIGLANKYRQIMIRKEVEDSYGGE